MANAIHSARTVPSLPQIVAVKVFLFPFNCLGISRLIGIHLPIKFPADGLPT